MLKTLSQTFVTIKVLDFRVIRRQRQCLFTKKPYFFSLKFKHMFVQFFSLTWSKGFMWLNKFLNLCFQGTCKQIIKANKQAIDLSFFHLKWF